MSSLEWTAEGAITIPASKGKMLLVFLGAMIFVYGSVFLFIQEDTPVYVLLISSISLLFFGAIAVSSIKKLFISLSYGLRINDRGVDDRSSGVSVGLVHWAQIRSFKITQVKSTRFILIYVEDPESIIDQFKGLTKLLLKANHKTYGTPISISVIGLKCSFKTLERIIKEAFKRYK